MQDAEKTSRQDDEPIVAYVTKYALTTGVVRVQGSLCRRPDGETVNGMLRVTAGPYTGAYLHGEGRHWHRSAEAAAERVRRMVRLKRLSLKREMAKLDATDASLDVGLLTVDGAHVRLGAKV